MTVWSPGQQDAIAQVGAWLRIRYAPFFYLAGYAGTGKTTLAQHIAGLQNGQVRYMAFTGKAAKVMKQSGCAGARTIHSSIYNAEINFDTGERTFTLNPGALEDVALVILDEASMVDEDLGRDLLSFGVPVLVLGDPGQLPPVRGAGFFTSGKKDAMLTEIHRQAADSPIIRLATDIREGRFDRQPTAEPGLTICRKTDLDGDLVVKADAVIVGRNATRAAYNARLRERRGYTDKLPQKGETVICLRNDGKAGVVNGETFTVGATKVAKRKAGRVVHMTLSDPDDKDRPPVKATVFENFFMGTVDDLPFRARSGTQEFDYGYCMTVHKSQGSQWPSVAVFDESQFFKEYAREHLYTAVTRASKHLTLVI